MSGPDEQSIDPEPREGAAGPVESEEGTAAGQSVATAASRGFLWANVGVVTRYISALILAALLARHLDTLDYKVMVTLMIFTFYFDNALDLGMGAALVYEQEEGVTERVQVAFTANVILAVFLAAVAFFVAPVITTLYHLEGYVLIFRLLAVIVLLSGLTTIPWALLMRGMDFRARAAVEVSRDMTRFVLTVGLVALGLEAWAILLGLIAAYAVWLTGTWLAIRFRPVIRWDAKIMKELFAYAWRMAGTRLLGVLALNGDYLIVGNRTTRRDQYGQDEMSLYYQAFRLPEFILGAQLNAMSAVLFPMYSRIRSEGKMAMSDALYRALRLIALFSIPTGIGLALVARDAILVMYGTPSPVAIRTMELLSIAGCFVGVGFASGDLLFAIGKPGVMARINVVMVPTMLIAMWIVAPYGIVWVATVHLVTAAVFQTARQLIVNRIVGASTLETARCLVPSLIISAFVLLFALPVRLLTGTGFVSMLAIVAAGVVGGALGLVVSPSARHELSDVMAKVRG